MKVLVTIASEQIWPQIIPFYVIKPEKVVIIHSGNFEKSKNQANRLADFWRNEETKLCCNSVILREMKELDYPDFLSSEISSTDEVFVNLTGGLKTMSLMLHTWAILNKAREFYINEKNKIQWFLFSNNEFSLDREEPIPVGVVREINGIDPVSIAKLYYGPEHIIDGSLVETTNDIHNISKKSSSNYKNGVKLEIVLLNFFLNLFKKDKRFDIKNCKLRHSVRLKSANSDIENEEIDILINYNCTLIIVESKMRRKVVDVDASYKQMIANCYNGKKVENAVALEKLIGKINSDISQNKFLQFKSDLYSARLLSGLKAKVLWVTTSMQHLPEHLERFCREHNIKHINVSFGLGENLSMESRDKLTAFIARCL